MTKIAKVCDVTVLFGCMYEKEPCLIMKKIKEVRLFGNMKLTESNNHSLLCNRAIWWTIQG